MEITSTVVNHRLMTHAKNSLLQISEKDGEGEFRVDLIEYINDSSWNNDDKFFFDMLTHVRFLDPSDDAVAYTDQYTQIWLNAPGDKIGKKMPEWNFVYDHECLHQLWDTFGVADEIKKNGEPYNHTILNIASDCVINDYLSRIRKKKAPDFGITPESIEKKFGVKYDILNDTQYTLYLKLMKKQDEIMKDQEIMDLANDKIQPKSVTKLQGPPPPPPPPTGKFPPDFVKGWVDAIKDVQQKKVDPTDKNLKPKNTGNSNYDDGYNSAMKEMKEGMENGISISDNSSQNGGESDSGLPQIPWDMGDDNKNKNNEDSEGSGSGSGSDSSSGDSKSSDSSNSSNSAQKSADNAKSSADAAQAAADAAKQGGDNDASDKANAAKKAKDAAEKAQAAADAAKDAMKNGDKDAAKKSAEEAAKAAEEAAKAAGAAGVGTDGKRTSGQMAKDAADNAKKNADAAQAAAQGGSKEQKDAAKAAASAAKDAQKAADKAQAEEAKGNTEGAKKAALEAQKAADEAAVQAGKAGVNNTDADHSANSSAQASSGQGHGGPSGYTLSKQDLEAIKADGDKKIKKYAQKLTGSIGKFISKCKQSQSLDKSPLSVHAHKASNGWAKKMTSITDSFFARKVWEEQQLYRQTYKRPNRREDYVKPGQAVMPGRKRIEEKLNLSLAFYIDRSGSMGDSGVTNAFNACYKLCEKMKDDYNSKKVVDEVTAKIFAFDRQIIPIPYGKRCECNGCTFDMDELCEGIEKHTSDVMVNIVITDGDFNVNRTEVKKFVERLDGILIFIINKDQRDVEAVSKMIKDQLFYIKSDSDFIID